MPKSLLGVTAIFNIQQRLSKSGRNYLSNIVPIPTGSGRQLANRRSTQVRTLEELAQFAQLAQFAMTFSQEIQTP